MSSPLVGHAKVEITGDLDAFARNVQSGVRGAMTDVERNVRAGFNEVASVSKTTGKSAGDDFANNLKTEITHGVGDLRTSIHGDVNSLERVYGEGGKQAGDAYARELQSEVKSGVGHVGSTVHDELDQTSRRVGQEGDKAGRGWSSGMHSRISAGMGGIKASITDSMKGIGGIVVGALAFDKVKDFVSGAMDEARESQKVGAQTVAVIKGTGDASRVTADQVGNLAGAISKYAGVDDEAIQSGENMLLTFTNIHNEQGKGNDIFTQATKIMTDMSVSMGTDMKGQAIQLGKALNDPIKGVGALSKVGVTFTDQQKEQIKQMIKVGDTAGAQRIILKELSKEFGGSAAAQATAGDKASVAWGNLKEQIGTAMIPVLDKFEGILTNDVIPAISSTVGFLEKHSTAVKIGAVALGLLVAALLAAKVGLAAYRAVQGVSAVLSGEQAAATSLQTVALAAQKVALGISTAAQWAFNAAMDANPVMLVVLALAALVAGLVWAYNKVGWFRDFVQAAFGLVVAAGKAVASFFTDDIPAAFNWFMHKVHVIVDDVLDFLKKWGPRALVVLAPFIGIPLLIYRHWSQITTFLGRVWTASVHGVKNFVGDLISVVASIPGRIIHLGQLMWDAGAKLISKLFGGIGHILSGVGGFASNVAHTIVNGIVDAINSVLHLPWKFPKITIYNPVPGMDDFHIGGFTMLPAIPEWHAKGGELGLGWNMVGEEGMEAIYNSGSKQTVYSNPSTMHLLGSASQPGAGGLTDEDRALLRAVATRPVHIDLAGTTVAKARLSTVVADGDLINGRRQGAFS